MISDARARRRGQARPGSLVVTVREAEEQAVAGVPGIMRRSVSFRGRSRAADPAGSATCGRAGRPANGEAGGARPPAEARPRRVLRTLVVPVASAIYLAVRPAVGSDAAGLAIAGAVPAAYAIVVVVAQRRVEPWAILAAVGFALGCIASLLAGGNSLPLKLHEAAVTAVLGLVLLAAVLVRRPPPVGRVLKVPQADRAVDAALSVMVGSFLVLHALPRLTLALTLSTAAYLTAGRLVSWMTLGAGALCPYSYLRRLRRRHAGTHANPHASTRPPARRS